MESAGGNGNWWYGSVRDKSEKANFERLRLELAKTNLGDNANPTLRQAIKVMAFFRLIEQKTPLDI